MALHLCSEEPGDEEAIEFLTYRAFAPRDRRGVISDVHETDLVHGLRTSYPRFERRYSVTAWDEGALVGHALFTPARVRLMGETVEALAVGPVSVVPERQRQGIGGALLRRGHDLGREDGFQLAFLMGHPEYYPRHGYVPCYGLASVALDVERLPEPTREFTPLPVQSGDLPWLVECCAAEWADVDFGWLWEPHRSAWTLPNITALVWWTAEGRRAAYTLSSRSEERKWKLLLADDVGLAREMLATIRPPSLDQHPSGWLAREVLDPGWGRSEARPSEAAMACELQEGVLQPYLEALASGTRPPGACNWALPFAVLI